MPGARSYLVDCIYDFHVLCLIRDASSASTGCDARRLMYRSVSDAALGPSANDKLIRAGVTCD